MEYIKTEHYDHVRNDYGREMVIPSEKEWTEVKRGRWIQHKAEGWEGGGVTRCNYCNYGYAWGAFFEVENFNYCPNCGARMEASDD